LSIGEQLRQRAAMGGERERAELAAFDKLLADAIAGALIADLEKEAAANGVDVRTGSRASRPHLSRKRRSAANPRFR